MKRLLSTLAAIAVLAFPVFARADEIHFKNGDKLTGKIVSADGGKLTIKSNVAGAIEVDLADVRTFSSDEPITLKLKDGTILKQPVTGGPEGQIALKGGA